MTARPVLLIYEPMFAEAVDALRPQIGCESYVVMGDEAPAGEWTYEDALADGSPEGVEMPPLDLRRHLGHHLHLWHHRPAQRRPGHLWQLFLQRRGDGAGD